MAQVRKLATIMSVDIAGYSRSAERDEGAAAEGVGRLKLALSEIAAARGGRIFNTAGDGVMLEFPTASAGLTAAEDLMRRTDLPRVRIGLNLGEVIVDGDDLLGHGVNVAARLQALADPGAAMISHNMSAQAHQNTDFQLTPCGRIRLNKMDETVSVFALSLRSHRTSNRLRLRRFRPAILALAALTVAGLSGVTALLASRTLSRPASSIDSTSIAVLPFTSLNVETESANYADSVTATVASALTEAGLTVVSQNATTRYRDADRAKAARELGARYLVDGDIRQDGDLIRVIIRIDDGRSGVTLLSDTVESHVAEAASLPNLVAARIASLGWAFGMRVPGDASVEATESYFRHIRLRQRGESLAAFEGSRAFARAHPNEALALHQFAVLAGFAYSDVQIDELPEAMREARAADQRSRELSPRFGDAYIAATMLMPAHLWAEQEAHLRRGMEIDADGPSLRAFLGYIYVSVGRTREAEALHRVSAAQDPFNPTKVTSLIYVLIELGEDERAQTIIDRTSRMFPDYPDVANARFRASSFSGAPSGVEILMRNPAIARVVEPPGGPPVVASMVRALASRRSRDIDAAVRACASESLSSNGKLACLEGFTLLGRLDEAFNLTDRLYPERRAATPEREDEMWLHRETPPMSPPRWLFKADLARLRADPRFIPLTQRIGLFHYWRTTNQLPDFCATEPTPICDRIRQR